MGIKGKISIRGIRIIIIVIFLVCSGIIANWFLNCIRDYHAFDKERLDLVYEELTFEKYERHSIRGSVYYDIYFKEYEESFQIASIYSFGVDQAMLDALEENDILKVTFCKNFGDICEISFQGKMIVYLSDYIYGNQSNEKWGMFGCVLVFLWILWLAWIALRALEPLKANGGLGKLRMEYTVKGNVIRIYHSIHVCSLVINDQIFDQHRGIYGADFCLKGIIGTTTIAGKPIRIEAKMGFSHMRLYCNGQLVAKKFMAFG